MEEPGERGEVYGRGRERETRTYVDDGSDDSLDLTDGAGGLGSVGAGCAEGGSIERISTRYTNSTGECSESTLRLPSSSPGLQITTLVLVLCPSCTSERRARQEQLGSDTVIG